MYNGYSEGLWPKYSLQILGRSVDEGLFGFGASISDSLDMNRDNINGWLIFILHYVNMPKQNTVFFCC